jgi:hypothetical protein
MRYSTNLKEICLFGFSFDEKYLNDFIDENSFIIYECGYSVINKIPIELLNIVNFGKKENHENKIFIKFNQKFFYDEFIKLDISIYNDVCLMIKSKNNIPINIYFEEQKINKRGLLSYVKCNTKYREIGPKDNIVNKKYTHYITTKINGFIIISKNNEKINNVKISFDSKIITDKYDLDYFVINKIYEDFNSNGLIRYFKFDFLENFDEHIIGDIIIEINNCDNLNVDIYPIYDNFLEYNSGFIGKKYSFN